ncbi:hypothetical protein D3C76_1682000 [compost metagenome]
MFDQLGEVVGVVIHVVAIPRLARAPVTAAIMGDGAKAVVGKVQHLRFPTVGAQWPTVAEHHWLPVAPVLVIQGVAFASRESSHVFRLQ